MEKEILQDILKLKNNITLFSISHEEKAYP